jgi:hypothetical protein
MSIFLYEFFYFLACSLAILVSISSAVLFFTTYRHERKMQTGWRALGFLLLAGAFLFLIVERKSPAMGIFAVTVQAIAFFMIFRGVLAEPKLLHLRQITPDEKKSDAARKKFWNKDLVRKTLIWVATFLILISVLLVPGYLYIKSFLASIIEALTAGFIVATIVLQVRRYLRERAGTEPKERRQNLYPLVGYVFLFIHSLAMIFNRLPDSNIVFLRKLSLEYSIAWQIGVLAIFLAFIYLGIWAWNFIKVRPFLKTYVVFISTVILVAALGALIFTFFIFKIVEKNNLDLMLKGAETESIIMNDRANTATFVARLAALDEQIIKGVKSNDYNAIDKIAQGYLKSANVDILRIYNGFGEIIDSPSDPRDKGKVLANDSLVAYALKEKSLIRTFDNYPGILSDFIVVRAVHPIIVNNTVLGAVEAGYKFDNAFVDFSKENTNLDVTIYTGPKISATTIKTLDGVSRFVGSEEADSDISKQVLGSGQNFTGTIDRFSENYYSAFKPVRDTNGEIIGMVAVGTPTFILLEETRQKLLSTLIIIAAMSALISLIGYYIMPRAEQQQTQILQ